MSPAIKNILLLVVLLGVLGAAGWFFVRGDPEKEYPTEASSNTMWKCTKCGWEVELTAAEVQDWLNSDDKVRKDRSMGRITVFWCPQCQEFTVVRAEKCSRHNIYFCTKTVDGTRLDCPKCVEEFGMGRSK